MKWSKMKRKEKRQSKEEKKKGKFDPSSLLTLSKSPSLFKPLLPMSTPCITPETSVEAFTVVGFG
jgi:hypothetical protein